MASKALFGGLVIDEWEQPVEVTTVGGEAFYVVNDAGFRRHISWTPCWRWGFLRRPVPTWE